MKSLKIAVSYASSDFDELSDSRLNPFVTDEINDLFWLAMNR